jgi:hypothetical protein
MEKTGECVLRWTGFTPAVNGGILSLYQDSFLQYWKFEFCLTQAYSSAWNPPE